MYDTIKFLHSYWAYLVLLVLIIATVNALVKFFGNKEFQAFDFRVSLFTLITSHIQLLLGLIFFFVSDYMALISDMGMNSIMGNDDLRSKIIEHPFAMIIAVVLITIGYSKHKKKLTSKPKFKLLAIFYTIALAFVLYMIPWKIWLGIA
ncbi:MULTISPECIES: hypothetical protein [Flavobacteriaceae]|uniref:50S ribosomal protein L27 n=1 Tax=Gaetbulibacter jejuensis TaxID=584607 RepID=A0ABN1JD99_9FLAO|nr:hypothetical protein [Meridianimaribacter sp. CL38]TBV25085.1 hypothetical protein DMZ43_12275 [Meridianimaribacter sp. CL38]